MPISQYLKILNAFTHLRVSKFYMIGPYHPRLNSIEQWFNQVKHYMKIYKSNDFPELNSNLKKSINNINKDNYKNYFIYAYNKDLYKTLKRKKLSTKHRTLKIYKN